MVYLDWDRLTGTWKNFLLNLFNRLTKLNSLVWLRTLSGVIISFQDLINPGLKGKALKASTEKLWLVYIVRWRWNVDTDLTLLRGFRLLSLTVYLSQDGKLLMSKQVFSRVYVSLGCAHVVHVFYPLAQQRYKDESTMLLLYIWFSCHFSACYPFEADWGICYWEDFVQFSDWLAVHLA